MQLIDHASAAQFISVMAPDWVWLLQHIESEDGYVCFPPLVSRWISNLNIGNYPELYEEESRIGAMMLCAFFTPDEIRELDAKLVSLSPEDRAILLRETMADMKLVGDAFELPKTQNQQKRANELFNALSPEEKKNNIEFMQRFLMAVLASFYQLLSIMVHGEKLTSLVAQAKSGNAKAFAKAIQIDKRILIAIPHFKKRFEDAHTEGDHKFTENVGAHMSRPPYKGKIRHKALYLAFAFLDQVGLLTTLKHGDILDLCNDAGLDSHASRIDDVKNLSKRLAEYRAFQQRGLGLSTP